MNVTMGQDLIICSHAKLKFSFDIMSVHQQIHVHVVTIGSGYRPTISRHLRNFLHEYIEEEKTH